MTWCSEPHVSTSSPRSAARVHARRGPSRHPARESRPVLDELDADHQPRPRTSPIRSSSAIESCSPAISSAPRARGVRDQALVADRARARRGRPRRRPGCHRTSSRGHLRPSAPGARAGRDQCRQRQAVGDRLRDDDHVGHDSRVLDRPHRPGPPVAGLDLVGDEQDPVLVAEGPKLAQERGRRRRVAALALDRLDEDRRDPSAGITVRTSSCSAAEARRRRRVPRRRRSRDTRPGTARSRRPAGAARSRSGSSGSSS